MIFDPYPDRTTIGYGITPGIAQRERPASPQHSVNLRKLDLRELDYPEVAASLVGLGIPYPPSGRITRQRVLLAQRVLERDPTITIDALAHRCGFTHADLLRHHFRGHLGTTPSTYRRTTVDP